MLVKDFVEITSGVDTFEYEDNNNNYYDFSHTRDVPEACANKKIVSIRFYIDAYDDRCCEITFDDK